MQILLLSSHSFVSWLLILSGHLSSTTAQTQLLPTATLADNLPDASAYAFLPFAGKDTNIKGRFDFQSAVNGSTRITFSLAGFAANTSFPVRYFIAARGVPHDGLAFNKL